MSLEIQFFLSTATSHPDKLEIKKLMDIVPLKLKGKKTLRIK